MFVDSVRRFSIALVAVVATIVLSGCEEDRKRYADLKYEGKPSDALQADGSYLLAGPAGAFTIKAPAGWVPHGWMKGGGSSREAGNYLWFESPDSGRRMVERPRRIQISARVAALKEPMSVVEYREHLRRVHSQWGSIDEDMPSVQTAEGKTAYILKTRNAKPDLGPKIVAVLEGPTFVPIIEGRASVRRADRRDHAGVPRGREVVSAGEIAQVWLVHLLRAPHQASAPKCHSGICGGGGSRSQRRIRRVFSAAAS